MGKIRSNADFTENMQHFFPDFMNTTKNVKCRHKLHGSKPTLRIITLKFFVVFKKTVKMFFLTI